jgi:hypothetical protein
MQAGAADRCPVQKSGDKSPHSKGRLPGGPTLSSTPAPAGPAGGTEARQEFQRVLEEVARLSEAEQAPADYYRDALPRLLAPLGATGGAIWALVEGRLTVLYHINAGELGFAGRADAVRSHDALLRHACRLGRPLHVPPHSNPGPDGGQEGGENPTDYAMLLAPVRVDGESVGLLQLWHPGAGTTAPLNLRLAFLAQAAGLISLFRRNHQRRELLAQQRLWTQLESFSCHVHGSLNPTEVAYTLANGARRLIDCDRISVVLCQGRRAEVAAVSGCDVVETRSNQVKRLRLLCGQVLAWGEKLIYRGTRDDGLPPPVLKALDAYLAESQSKLLVVQPVRDERDQERGRPPRAALVLESFEPTAEADQPVAQLDVVARHAAPALYNALEYRRIPFRWFWRPLAAVQEGLGGKARVALFLVGAGVAALVVSMLYLSYPLKMDAQGQLLPVQRCWIYSPVEAQVVGFAEGVQPGKTVTANQSLVLMHDVDLELQLVRLASEIAGAGEEIAALARQQSAAATEGDKLHFAAEKKQKEYVRERKIQEYTALRERTHSDQARPGYFWLQAPIRGTLLNWDFRDSLTNRFVKPSEPLLRIGDKDRRWEVELRIPQKHIGQVLHAYDPRHPERELDVDLLLLSCPTRTFKGKLSRARIASEAGPDREDTGDSEPVVLASVRLDGPDIPGAERIPRDLLVTGTEVHTKIRCGDRPLGYSLFYGVWEFAYEKVVFFFKGGS